MRHNGKNIPHDSAVTHVTGESEFIDDMPVIRGEVVVGWLGSPVAHGRLKGLDLEGARSLPGVVGLFTASDLGGHNLIGTIVKDEPALADDILSYVGQPIVVIAAESRYAVEKARRAIRLEVEELEPVLSIEHAIEKDQYLGWKRRIERGNPEAVFASGAQTFEGELHIAGQEQFYLESQAAYAIPGEQGRVTVYSSTQHTTEVQDVVAETLGLGFHEVVCICRRMGGAFGGKESQAGIPAIMAALAATKTRRPARLIYDKDNDMRITGKRHAYLCRFRVAHSAQGELLAVRFAFFSNGGAFADLSTSILERTMLHADSAYFVPDIEIEAAICRTNIPPNTAFRGFGGPQGVAAMEHVMQEIARRAGRDAYDLRVLNCYGIDERNTTPYGQIVTNNLLPEILKRLRASSLYDARRRDIDVFNRQSRTHLRGLAMTPVKFGISFTTAFLNQANALVNVYSDGSVQVSSGGTEMGQGLYTKLRMIAADEFGIALDRVIVMPTSTEKNNNTSPTAASAGTDLNGWAVIDACSRIRERLANVAAQHLADPPGGVSVSPSHMRFHNDRVFDERRPENSIAFGDLCRIAHRSRVSIGERGFYATPGVEFNRETGKGQPFHYFTQGAAVAEVLVDRFTGEVRVPRVDILLDLGRMINPGIDRGQTTGGFIQGMGWVTTEELRYDQKGNLLSYSPTTYKIPNIQDTPQIFNVDFIENPHNTRNVRGSKAVGEPPLLLGISVWAAVKDALYAALPEGSAPVSLNLPASGEAVLLCLSQQNPVPMGAPR